jgi:phytoene dehydrogenase-like protein
MKTILTRLREPSTYAGLSALLALGGVHIPEAKFQAITNALAALAAAAAVFMGESTNVPPAPPSA